MKIVSTYHHSFAGGSKNTSRLLQFLSRENCDIHAFFFQNPQYFNYTESNIKINVINASLYSDVIDSKSIDSIALTDMIFNNVDSETDTILFGANLFPYCNSLLNAKKQLEQVKKINSKLIIHPVGSDIWQIGPQIRSQVKWILNSPLVDSVLTYSNGFIEEIKEYYDIELDIHELPPIIELNRFFPLDISSIKDRRKKLGFGEDDFIIHHHSSMRPIKAPEIVIEIAKKSAENVKRSTILIMTGPIPIEKIKELRLNLTKIENNKPLLFKTKIKNLEICWTGVVSNVEYLLQISDLELNTSLHDSFNISLMEAMACGIPVLTSDIVGISKHINKSDSGFCFPTKKLNFDQLNSLINSKKSKKSYFDISYAIDCILFLANNKKVSQQIGIKGHEYVKDNFCSNKIMSHFKKIITL